MDLAAIRSGKTKLEDDIHKLIRQFEQDYDLAVEAVDVDRIGRYTIGDADQRKTELYHINVDLKIF